MKDDPVGNPWKSIFLVGLQFISLGLIFLSGPLLPDAVPLLVLELGGLFLGVWAVLSMGAGNLHIAPVPLARSKMVRSGPYRFIRHPMYLALLLVTLPLILEGFTIARSLVWMVLLLTLVAKISYEEKLLEGRYPSYQVYQQTTSRLIPGLY